MEIEPSVANIELFRAAAQGNDYVVYNMLQVPGVNVDVEDRRGYTALMMAILRGDPTIVLRLLAAGANPNRRVPVNGITPLLLAMEQGNLEIVKTLIDAGANVNVRNNTGDTPLIVASFKGSIPLVKLLIDSGADKKAIDRYRHTALYYPSMLGHGDMVRYMLHEGVRLPHRIPPFLANMIAQIRSEKTSARRLGNHPEFPLSPDLMRHIGSKYLGGKHMRKTRRHR
jgi:ankyrin repeat protein